MHLKSNIGGITGNTPKREESARQLLAHVAEMRALHKRETGTEPTIILAGDFNTSPADPRFKDENTAQMILDAGFVWGFQGLPESETFTWLTDGRYSDPYCPKIQIVDIRPARETPRRVVTD